MWWFKFVKEHDGESGIGFDGGRLVVEADTLLEAEEKMGAIVLQWTADRHGSYQTAGMLTHGPYSTKEETEKVNPYPDEPAVVFINQ